MRRRRGRGGEGRGDCFAMVLGGWFVGVGDLGGYSVGRLGGLRDVGGRGAKFLLETGCEGAQGVRWLYVLFMVERDWSS